MIKCDLAALQAVKDELSRMRATGPVRIELCFTGCCDPSLGLRVDSARESDLVHEVEGVKLIISSETCDLVGNVTITYINDAAKKGFVLTSSKPVSEWDGFTACNIRDTPASRAK
jgi:Fe-S cluster assembly iron-binding protein IscA